METLVEQQILAYLRRLNADQRQQVLNYVRSLPPQRPEGIPGRVFIERTRHIQISSDDLSAMQQAIEEECERIDRDAWELSD